jgi:hypothetical protein
MWRTRAVVNLLLQDVCGLPEEPDRPAVEILRRARRRALLVVLLDLAALAVLFTLRERERAFLTASGGDAIFTLGVLAVAVHAGFRLAQARVLRAVAGLSEDLVLREPEN